MIRNVVIHLTNEQPLLADLPVAPAASDISLICTNLRTLNGKRPVFADDAASLFVFPYAHIRFLEVPPAALTAAGEAVASGEVESAAGTATNGRATVAAIIAAAAEATRASAGTPGRGDAASATSDAGPASATAGAATATAGAAGDAGAAAAPVADDPETELEIDEDFLRRVREI